MSELVVVEIAVDRRISPADPVESHGHSIHRVMNSDINHDKGLWSTFESIRMTRLADAWYGIGRHLTIFWNDHYNA